MILSCPSYVIPGTWWENIQYIDRYLPEITNVELLFFIYDEETRRLLAPEEKAILSYNGRLTFTVHLPDPLLPEHDEIIDKTSFLAVNWIIHPPKQGEELPFTKAVDSLRLKYGNRFLLENLTGRNHPWFIKHTEWPLCLDTGHALLRGHSPGLYFNRFKKRIKEIHLLDICEGKDHSPLLKESIWLRNFIPLLYEYSGIVNIELFNKDEVSASVKVMKQHLPPV